MPFRKEKGREKWRSEEKACRAAQKKMKLEQAERELNSFRILDRIDCSQRGSSYITFRRISFIELSMQAFVSHVSCLMGEMSEKRKGGGGGLGENNKALTLIFSEFLQHF